ncbi:MAG: crossover junction endodeoxyribonuclease RuvC [Rickettsiaceae bacterium]
MFILGIDPSLTSTGWGLIDCQGQKLSYTSSGTIKTSSKDKIHQRLAYIANQIDGLMSKYNPPIVAMEESFVNKNPSTSLKLGCARGAIMSILGKHEIQFHEFKPNLIKKFVTGFGYADKKQVFTMLKILLSIPETISALDDESDALAIAYTASFYKR